MSKISREDNKKRFKTGMYPTQQDFENVLDSYVHKDDTIDPSQVMSGDENIIDIINRKAEEKHSHEIKDVDGLEKFIDEMTSLLEIVRDPDTGEISQSKLQTLTEGIAALRDDIDANADNIAGHETRITNNTAALEKVYAILGKDAKESINDLANRFAALSGNYANVYAFVNKVKQFLEDADASDETINRWQEIETFLQGITDTETLTGLLADLKTEIQDKIPQGNFLEQVEDLDSYTDAPDGKIVQYIGQTNDKYIRAFTYERVSKGYVFTLFPIAGNLCYGEITESDILGKSFIKSSKSITLNRIKILGDYYYYEGELQEGTVLFLQNYRTKTMETKTITRIEDGYIWINNSWYTHEELQPTTVTMSSSNYENGNVLISELEYGRNENFEHNLSEIPFIAVCFVNDKLVALYSITEGTMKKGNLSFWQHIHNDNVIS